MIAADSAAPAQDKRRLGMARQLEKIGRNEDMLAATSIDQD
jgi:hypothetical protein